MTFALLFPGQGCQYIGMCKQLIEQYPVAAAIFEEANMTLGFDLRALILTGNLKTLTLSENAQPAMVTASYALFQVFCQQTETMPACIAGHSLGELSALIAAGALPFAAGVLFARKRGQIMHRALQEKKGRAGIVVDLAYEVLTQLIAASNVDDYVAIAGYNSPQQVVVAGHPRALASLSDAVEQHGGDFIPFRMIPMKADAPYHTTLMTFLQPELEAALQDICFEQPTMDVWSTVIGRIIQPTDSIGDILRDQLILPVAWTPVLEKMTRAGVDCFIDIGPQKIIRNLVRENPNLPTSYAFDEPEDAQKIRDYFAGGLYDYSVKRYANV